MRRLVLGIFALGLMISCDDGEIIVTNFDFEDSSLALCSSANNNVLYATNNTDVFESISLEFSNNALQIDDETGRIIPPEEEQVSFSLSGSNRVVYRIYNADVPSNYFCSSVPPSSPDVVEEWISGSEGNVIINTNLLDETGDADADGDNLNNNEEGWDPDGVNHQDTDDDGIPDYLDVDDDGDNVKTITEISSEISENVTAEGYPDTDGDGIPNYLDNDDDNDGVLTRFEVEISDNPSYNPVNFRTAEGISNYLNDEQTASFQHDWYIDHDISRRYGIAVTLTNVKFEKQGAGDVMRFERLPIGVYNTSNINFPLCPSQDPDCSEEDNTEEEEETN